MCDEFLDLYAQGLELKLEKLKSPQQWQITIVDIAKHGAAGIPKEAIFSVMKVLASSELCRNYRYNKTY